MTPLGSGLSRRELATRTALDIPEDSVVNLGIGAPTLVADAIPDDVEVILHTENGMPATGPAPAPGRIDPDLINAGKQPVTERPGASSFHHADSFAMMRGGHLDICVLGAFQVSEHGDLANWHTGAADAIPAVGGAMDLAIGARSVWVMTDLLTRDGTPKLVAQCSYAPHRRALRVPRLHGPRGVRHHARRLRGPRVVRQRHDRRARRSHRTPPQGRTSRPPSPSLAETGRARRGSTTPPP